MHLWGTSLNRWLLWLKPLSAPAKQREQPRSPRVFTATERAQLRDKIWAIASKAIAEQYTAKKSFEGLVQAELHIRHVRARTFR